MMTPMPNNAAANLLAKIQDRTAVVGLGYFGLPLAVAFAEAGYRSFHKDGHVVDSNAKHIEKA
jgi:UDP-N-acetyl-D-mannosaminuronate dehydrogenase